MVMNVHFCPDEKQRLAAGGRGREESRTVTFDSEHLTIMISITPGGHDLVRLDGWLAPAGRHAVELRTSGGPRTAVADADGRFVIDDVPHGLAQLVVRPDAGRAPRRGPAGTAAPGGTAAQAPGGTAAGGAVPATRSGPVVTPAIVV
jgi:hypothetical protein